MVQVLNMVGALVSLGMTGHAAACMGQLACPPSVKMDKYCAAATLLNMTVFFISFFCSHLDSIFNLQESLIISAASLQGYACLTTCMFVSSVWLADFTSACSEAKR
jgi:hypothetical protein